MNGTWDIQYCKLQSSSGSPKTGCIYVITEKSSFSIIYEFCICKWTSKRPTNIIEAYAHLKKGFPRQIK